MTRSVDAPPPHHLCVIWRLTCIDIDATLSASTNVHIVIIWVLIDERNIMTNPEKQPYNPIHRLAGESEPGVHFGTQDFSKDWASRAASDDLPAEETDSSATSDASPHDTRFPFYRKSLEDEPRRSPAFKIGSEAVGRMNDYMKSSQRKTSTDS